MENKSFLEMFMQMLNIFFSFISWSFFVIVIYLSVYLTMICAKWTLQWLPLRRTTRVRFSMVIKNIAFITFVGKRLKVFWLFITRQWPIDYEQQFTRKWSGQVARRCCLYWQHGSTWRARSSWMYLWKRSWTSLARYSDNSNLKP